MLGRHYVIVFDVSDDKRRRLLTKLLLNYSYRVQHSVFEMYTQFENTKKHLEERIKKIVDSKDDSVIIYELGALDWPKKVRIGSSSAVEKQYEGTFLLI